MKRSGSGWKRWLVGCGVLALLGAGCSGVEEETAASPGEASASLEPGAPSTLTIGGQAFTLTWDDDFGGALGKAGASRSRTCGPAAPTSR